MTNLQSNTTKEGIELISKLKQAIAFEQEHQYINAIGKSGDFCSFIREQAQNALKVFKQSHKWQGIYLLMERYPYLDLTSRMQICKKILTSLEELKEIYEDELEQNKPKTKSKQINQIQSKLKIGELDIRFVKGVGEHLGNKLKHIGIETCEDLLNYYPRDHIAYSDVTAIQDLELEQDVSLIAYIHKVTAFKSPRKNLIILSIIIKDNSGSLKINKYFQGNSTHYYLKQYKSQYPDGSTVLCMGRVKFDKFSKQKTLQDANIEVISDDISESSQISGPHSSQIVPIYRLTEGLSLRVLRKLIHQSLEIYKSSIDEFLPRDIIERQGLIPYQEALQQIHFPQTLEAKDHAAHRLLFNEFFLMQLRFMQLRHEHKKNHQGIQFNCFENGLVDKFIASLPFELTKAQQRVFFNEILPDLVSPEPMHRLLQGDVGSGKTIVAFMALLVAIADGYQGAIMVPTEILAEQHFRKFTEWINKMEEALQIRIALLIGKQKVSEKREVTEKLKTGEINLVVGTHALIQTGVEFKRLGLIVIDEQHRFGVRQRELLAQKAFNNSDVDLQLSFTNIEKEQNKTGTSVERLFMTATPIPRTLALAMHGDLDMSEIDEMPYGRLPVITSIVKRKSEAHKLIKDEINKGNQAYIVFPLIDESEALAAKAATVEYEKLKQGSFKNFKLGLIHGKLKDQEKEEIMLKFRNKEIDILVSTTVIEVGVDIPDATVILIESAHRFGLAQLHQLRGRVGRSDKQSYCMLSSNSKTENSLLRLNILCSSNNGFLVAQEDMKLRGTGDIAGLKQSGIPESVIQGLIDQEQVLYEAREEAKKLIENNSELDGLEKLKDRLKRSADIININAG